MTDCDILIIGAGAAGIGAARAAAASGLSCRIIEAKDRIGGRAHTDHDTLGTPFDLGASFIHAADRGNPWVAIATAHQAATLPDPRRRYALAAGNPVPDVDGGKAYLAARAQAFHQIERHADLGDAAIDPATLGAGPWAHSAQMAVGPWLAGCDTADLDAADWLASTAGEDWLLPAGLGSLVAGHSTGLEIELGIVARRIEIHPSHSIVETNNGTIRADRVILTASIGVLQAEAIAFDPPLESQTIRAIDGLAMGNLLKVGFEIAKDHPAIRRGHYIHIASTDPTLPLYMAGPSKAPAIMCFMGGTAALSMIREDPNLLIEAAQRPLEDCIGVRALHETLGRSLTTTWHDDPLVRGSYTNAKPGQLWTRAALRDPWHERLIYAGEANAPDGWQATVAGAYRAGQDAVHRLAGAIPTA